MASQNAINNSVADGNFTITSGNLLLPTTSSTVGQIQINSARWAHAYGTNNTFVGAATGNTTLSGAIKNVGVGDAALDALTDGDRNVAIGYNSLSGVTSGLGNIGIGDEAAVGVTTTSYCIAIGSEAMSNAAVTGPGNTAIGFRTLYKLTSGEYNTAMGYGVCFENTVTGSDNIGFGRASIKWLSSGNYNVGLGSFALATTTGSNNIAVGYQAGNALVLAESSNIMIGNTGTVGDGNTIRIGTQGSGAGQQDLCWIAGIRGVTTGSADAIAVLIDSTGQLGTASSSIRVKENVVDMGSSSDPIMKMRPVVFNYKQDKTKTPSYGLIAEEVDEVMPDLVVYGKDGLPETLKYHLLCPLLLNEIQKLSKRIEVLEAKLEVR